MILKVSGGSNVRVYLVAGLAILMVVDEPVTELTLAQVLEQPVIEIETALRLIRSF